MGAPPYSLLGRRHFALLAWLLAALGFLKACRFPNRWAATNFVLNYSQGFVRRGLVGEVARRLFGDAAFHYRLVVVFSFLVLATTAAAFLLLCRRALAERGPDAELESAILVYLASPALVMLVHLVGYLDYLGILFISAFAAAPSSPRRRWLSYALAALAGPILALIHEAQTTLFMPVVLFVLACHALRNAQRSPADDTSSPRRSWWVALPLASVLLLALGVSAYVSLNGDPQRVSNLDLWLHQRADFTLHYGVFRALHTGSPVSLLDTMRSFWSAPGAVISWFEALILFLPSYAFLGVVGWRAIGTADFLSRAQRAALRGLFLLACLSPLSLNVVAWDYVRWFALAVTNAMVCLLGFHACCRTTSATSSSVSASPRGPEPGAKHASRAPRLALAAVVTVVLGLTSDAILFNGAHVSYYPFIDQWQSLGELWKSGTLPEPPD